MPQDFSTSNEMRASKTSVTVIVMEFKDSCVVGNCHGLLVKMNCEKQSGNID